MAMASALILAVALLTSLEAAFGAVRSNVELTGTTLSPGWKRRVILKPPAPLKSWFPTQKIVQRPKSSETGSLEIMGDEAQPGLN